MTRTRPTMRTPSDRSRPLRVATALVLAACAATPASANDSTAELATGGAIFLDQDHKGGRSASLPNSAQGAEGPLRLFHKAARDVTDRGALPMSLRRVP